MSYVPQILLIDDEEEIVSALERILLREGFHVLKAFSFDEAKKILLQSSTIIDVIICDILLESHNGLEVLKLVSILRRNLPVILITGNPSIQTAEEAIRLKAFDYLPKPVDKRKLLEVIGKAIETKEEKDTRDYIYLEAKRKEVFYSNRLSDINKQNTTILNTTADAVITSNFEGKIIFVNQSACNVFQYSDSEFLSQEMNVLFSKEDSNKFSGYISQLVSSANQSAFVDDVVLVKKNGTKISADISICTYVIDHEQYYTAIIRDITNRKLLQEKLIDSEIRANMSTLASSIGHEINNSLAAILGFVEVAMLPGSKTESKERALQITLNQIDRLKILTSNLQQLGRVKKLDDEKEKVNLSELILKTLTIFGSTARTKNCKITVKIDEKPVFIQGVKSQLEILFINLLLNAADATNNRGNIQISLNDNEEEVHLVVEDDGHGIEKQDIDKIFEPYFTTKIEGNGTGLGLYVVKNVIQNHKANILVNSEISKGTVFDIVFSR